MDGNALILLSGGLDSAAMTQYYLDKKYDVSALFIDYGQVESREEERAAEEVASFFNIKLSKVEFSGFDFSSKAYVPARNSLLLTLALAFFKGENGIIAIGVHSGTNYPDCSALFIDSMQKIYDIYNDGKICIGAPFIDWNKKEILKYVEQKKIPLDILCSSNAQDFRRE